MKNRENPIIKLHSLDFDKVALFDMTKITSVIPLKNGGSAVRVSEYEVWVKEEPEAILSTISRVRSVVTP